MPDRGPIPPRPWRWLGALLAVPVSCWTRAQEQRIERLGEPLPPRFHAFARRLGLDPATVSLLAVPVVPHPLAGLLDLLPQPPWNRRGVNGMTLGNGIYLLESLRAPRWLVEHELVHVTQYRRLGSHRAFLARYLAECLAFGYAHAPLELEAEHPFD